MNKKRFAVFTGILLFLHISIFAQFITVKKDEIHGIRVNYRYDIEDLLGKIMLSDTISKINLEEV